MFQRVSCSKGERKDTLTTNETPGHDTQILSPRKRGLVIATGVIVAVTVSLGISPVFAIVPGFLILGAVIQRYHILLGRVVMWIGALILSVLAPLLGGAALATVRTLRMYHDFNIIGISVLYAVSFLLLCLCDVALIIDAIRWARA